MNKVNTISVALIDYNNAPNGTLLVKKDDVWQPTSFKELNKENEQRLQKLEQLDYQFDMLAKSNQHFTRYAKSHFMVVFNSFMSKVLTGELSVNDTTLLNLDELVLNEQLSVKEAIEKHPYLKKTFEQVYLNEKDLLTFPQV